MNEQRAHANWRESDATMATTPVRYVTYRDNAFKWWSDESPHWREYEQLEIGSTTKLRKHSDSNDRIWYELGDQEGELTTSSGPTVAPSSGLPALSLTAPRNAPTAPVAEKTSTVVSIGNLAVDPGGEGGRLRAALDGGDIRNALKNAKLEDLERIRGLPKK